MPHLEHSGWAFLSPRPSLREERSLGLNYGPNSSALWSWIVLKHKLCPASGPMWNRPAALQVCPPEPSCYICPRRTLLGWHVEQLMTLWSIVHGSNTKRKSCSAFETATGVRSWMGQFGLWRLSPWSPLSLCCSLHGISTTGSVECMSFGIKILWNISFGEVAF